VSKQLEAAQPDNVYVLEAQADEALQEKNGEGASGAIRYLENAIKRGATNPADFEELGKLLVAADRTSEAANVLRKGMQVAPYDAELYRLSAKIYFTLNKMQEACQVAAYGKQKFPQDNAIRDLSNRCERVPAGARN
jgi:predicted Zn-dependent protease